MAINDIVQTIAEARVDARSLSEFVFKPAGFKVARRLAPTVDTLQFYINRFNSLNGNFSSSVSVALSSLNNSVAEAEGKVAYIESTVQDAINNTAVEGGILADTFVTATANSNGTVARTQKDVNDDRVTLKSFGAKGDGVTDDTNAFILAVASKKPVELTEGKYILRTESIDCGADKLVLFSNSNAEIVLKNGGTRFAFDITNCALVSLKGIRFSLFTTHTNIFTCSPTSLVGELSIAECTFIGSVTVIRADASFTQDPATSAFGFKRVIYNYNKAENVNQIHFFLTNYPVYYCEFIGNKIHNFSDVYFGIAIQNGSANGSKIRRLSNVIADNNVVTNSDDWWNVDSSGSTYYCVMVLEVESVEWTNNKVSGMKSRKDNIELYDAYLSGINVVSKGNIYKNNANFATNNPNNFLMRAKSDTTSSFITSKVFSNNTYSIETEWLNRIGETACRHKMFSFGVINSGRYVVTDNTFSLHTLESSPQHVVTDLVLKNNTILTKYVDTSLSLFSFAPADAGVSTLQLIDNSISQTEEVVANMALLSNKSGEPAWGELVVINNNISSNLTGSNSSSIFAYVRALKSRVINNTLGMRMANGYDFISCFLKDAYLVGTYLDSGSTDSNIAISAPYLFGNSYSEQSFVGSPSTIMFRIVNVDGFTTTANKTIVSIDFNTSMGLHTISFNFTNTVEDGLLYVNWTDSNDVTYKSLTNSAENHGGFSKVEIGGGVLNTMRVRFNNRGASGTSFTLQDFPTSVCKFVLRVETFDV